jgi:hypothetical protein
MPLSAIGSGCSPQVVNPLLDAVGIRWGGKQPGQVRWAQQCPILLRCVLVVFQMASGKSALVHLQLSIPLSFETTFRTHTTTGGPHGIFAEQIAVVVDAARRRAEPEHPVLQTMDGTDVQTNFSRDPAKLFHGHADPDQSHTQKLTATEFRKLAVTRAFGSLAHASAEDYLPPALCWISDVVTFWKLHLLPWADETLTNTDTRLRERQLCIGNTTSRIKPIVWKHMASKHTSCAWRRILHGP